MDKQRGGWYDVMERALGPGEEVAPLRLARPQGVVAAGAGHPRLPHPGRRRSKNDEYLRLARESTAFYNAMFLDHDDGGVYFNVLANGLPYLLGTERLKGSHSMSGYHSFELAYLAQVYTNLLITHEPLDMHFKPQPGGFADNLLHVAADILPPGSIRIGEVWIDGEPYTDFDADGLTVKLPQTDHAPKVRVRIVPVLATTAGTMMSDAAEGVGRLTVTGVLDESNLIAFEDELNDVLSAQPDKLVLIVNELESIAPVSLRALIFSIHKLGPDTDIFVIGANPEVRAAFEGADLAFTAAATEQEAGLA